MQIAVVEEYLSKRPFAKVLALVLLANPTDAKVARECLKHLTSEDLKLWFIELGRAEFIYMYERQYHNIQGSDVEHELAKIIYRYVQEGRGEQVSQMQEKKTVRFEVENGAVE